MLKSCVTMLHASSNGTAAAGVSQGKSNAPVPAENANPVSPATIEPTKIDAKVTIGSAPRASSWGGERQVAMIDTAPPSAMTSAGAGSGLRARRATSPKRQRQYDAPAVECRHNIGSFLMLRKETVGRRRYRSISVLGNLVTAVATRRAQAAVERGSDLGADDWPAQNLDNAGLLRKRVHGVVVRRSCRQEDGQPRRDVAQRACQMQT